MDKEKVQKVIHCRESNAAEFRQLVREWPALGKTVEALQAQGLFPGLRGLQITLTGDQQFVDGGVASVTGENGLLARSKALTGEEGGGA
ncbi:MAG: hypothetical protein RSD57_13630 [Comamonas sp.]